jgi:hypothetical protein
MDANSRRVGRPRSSLWTERVTTDRMDATSCHGSPNAWTATGRSRATVGVFSGPTFWPSEPKAAVQHVAGGRPVGRPRGLRLDGVGRPLAFSGPPFSAIRAEGGGSARRGGRPVGRPRGLRPNGVGRPLAFFRANVFGHPSRRRRISTSRGVAPSAERVDCDRTESGDRWRFQGPPFSAIRAEGGGSARRGGSPRK